MRSSQLPALALAAGFVFALVARAGAADPQQAEVLSDPVYGRVSLTLPEQTTRGNWDGTWIYINRDVEFALWLRTENGKLAARLRYVGLMLSPESFETDWKGQAEYPVQDGSGRFAFTLTEVTPDRLAGTWDWVLDFGGSSRREHATLDIYRAGDGRNLVFQFSDFDRVVKRGGRESKHSNPQLWTFTKISKRQALWDELPF